MCQSMMSHCRYAWKLMMPKCGAQKYAMIAHSAGGLCVQSLWDLCREELNNKLKALVFTDSGYHGMFNNITRKEYRFL